MDDRHFATAGTVAVAGAFLFFGVVLLVTPLHLFQGLVPTPFLPLIVIFAYGLDRPASLPPWLTFGMGLLQDLLMGSAIGPWASVFLIVHALVIWQRSYFAGRDWTVLTTGFGLASLAALLIYWFELSILSDRTMPFWPLVWQWLVTALSFPLILTLFRRTIGRQRPSLAA